MGLGSGGEDVENQKVSGGMIARCLLSAAFCAAPALGAPDLEGTWTNASLTHFERPTEYGNRRALSQREVQELEKKNSDLVALGNKPTNPKATVKDLPADCSGGRGENCNYNAAWTDPGTTVMRVHGEPRSSFITFPDSGRLPAYTPEAIAAGSAVTSPRSTAKSSIYSANRPGISGS